MLSGLRFSSRPSARASARAAIQRHSKSFALASRLLPRAIASDAVVLYAHCRRADDAVDLATPAEQPARLRALHSELDALYAEPPLEGDPMLMAMRDLVARRRVPRAYLRELVLGMEMDTVAVEYETFEELLFYCYRVAGTVGLMMCHVMGVRDEQALAHAAHLGIAMQLTNIARDVVEDWGRGRIYLPRQMLEQSGARDLRSALGGPLPATAAAATARATAALLDRAEDYYRSGDAGMRYLSTRCAFAVRTARLVYSQIGVEARKRGCHPCAGRAVVSGRRKMALAMRAARETARLSPSMLVRPPPRIPRACLSPSEAIHLEGR